VRTTIVTPCGDDVDRARKLLDSLEANTALDGCEWLVVGNAKSKKTSEFLRKAQVSRPWMHVIPSKRPLETRQAYNLAARQSKAEYLVFLDSCTEVTAGWLEAMLSVAQRRENAGAVGAKLVGPDERVRQAGGVLFRSGHSWNVGYGDDPNDPEYNYVREVDWCSDVALLLRRDAFIRAGGFDENLNGRQAAVGLALSLREVGFHVWYSGHAQVIDHRDSESGDDWRPGFRSVGHAGMAELLERWPAELATLPPLPVSMAEARWMSDRRARSGKQLLMAAEELPQFDRNAGAWTFFRFMVLMIEAGHHVTFVSRNTIWRRPDVDLTAYVTQYQEAGGLLYGLDTAQEDGRAVPEEPAFKRILQNRQYDAALVWLARDGRWFLERVQQWSPSTRTAISAGDLQCLREGRGVVLSMDAMSVRDDIRDATVFDFESTQDAPASGDAR